MAEVNQKAVVRQDLRAAVAILFAGVAKGADDRRRQRGRAPLALIFGKQRKRGRFQFVGALHRLVHSARRAHMGADKFHAVLLLMALPEQTGHDN